MYIIHLPACRSKALIELLGKWCLCRMSFPCNARIQNCMYIYIFTLALSMSDVKIADITELHTLQFTVSQYSAKNPIGDRVSFCFAEKNRMNFQYWSTPKYRNSESLCICTCGFINSTIASILYVPLYASTVETFTVDQSSKLGTFLIQALTLAISVVLLGTLVMHLLYSMIMFISKQKLIFIIQVVFFL